MPQSKRFGKRFSSLFSVAAFGTRSRQKLSASILLALAAASVSTAAYAVRLQIFVNKPTITATTTPDVDTGAANDATGPSPSGTGPSATAVNTVTIPNGTHGVLNISGPTTGSSFSATATAVLAGPTGVSLTTASATGVTTKVNAQGIITYNGPANGTIEIVASNKFILPPGVWNTQRTGSQDSRGGTRCSRTAVTSPFATSAFCALNHTYTATTAAPSCSFCRTYDASEQGNVYRPVTGGQVPAAGVTVTLTSEVGFFNSNQNVEVRRELVGSTVLTNPPSTSGGAPSVTLSTTNSSFYLSTVKAGPEFIPCEPSTTGFPTNSFLPPAISAGSTFSCADNERKISRLKFTGLQTGDIINMPTTSTDLGTTDPGTLANLLDAKLLIDVQPFGVFANPDSTTNVANPYLPGIDGNWNPIQSTGKRQVLVLNSYTETGDLRIDACSDDLNNNNVTLSIAGSDPVHPESSEQAFLDKKSPCIGKIFFFEYGEVNSKIPGADPLATCQANPTVTLIASGVTLRSRFFPDLTVPTQKGGKPQSTTYVAPAGCEITNQTTEQIEVTCTTEVDAGAVSVVTCCTSCGN